MQQGDFMAKQDRAVKEKAMSKARFNILQELAENAGKQLRWTELLACVSNIANPQSDISESDLRTLLDELSEIAWISKSDLGQWLNPAYTLTPVGRMAYENAKRDMAIAGSKPDAHPVPVAGGRYQFDIGPGAPGTDPSGLPGEALSELDQWEKARGRDLGNQSR